MTLTICNTEIGGETLADDYEVKEDGYGCGRIRLGFLAGYKPVWLWFVNPPLPASSEFTGKAGTREEAMEQFKEAWSRFRAGLTPKQVEHWHQIEDAARRE